MKAIINGNIHERQDASRPFPDRGFRFGDGLFESIAVMHENPRLLSWHLERLAEGSKVLKLHAEEILKEDRISNEILQLKEANKIEGDAKARLYLYRTGGGLYSPESSSAHYIITIESAEFKKNALIPMAGFAEKAVNCETIYSRFKTLNALNFVIAGLEKKNQKWDEIIILDIHGNISEALSSNIFWRHGSHYFTPPLSTGCVAGVMRRRVIEKLKNTGAIVYEKSITKEGLLMADSIFTTNSMGIRHIERIKDRQFAVDKKIAGLANELD